MKKRYPRFHRWIYTGIFILLPMLLCTQDRHSGLLNEILQEKWRIPAAGDGITRRPPSQDDSRFSREIRFTENIDQFRSEGEPFIAVNPIDPDHIVVSFMDLGFELDFPVFYSHDGGDTWNRSTFSPIDTFRSDFPDLFVAGGGDPVLAFDASGKLYFTWIYLGIQSMTGTIVTYWAWSEDQGAHFSLAEGRKRFIESGRINLINAGILNEGNGIFDRPWLAVDRSGGPMDGTLYCTGLFLPSDSSKIAGEGLVIRMKHPGVDSFEMQQTQISRSAEAQFSNVAVDPEGRVHVTFMDLDSSQLMHALLEAGGGEVLSLDTIAFASGFSTPKVHARENPAPSLVILPEANSLFLAWSDFSADQVSGYFSRSDDFGATWSAKRSINQLFTVPFDQVLMPVLAENTSGHLVMTWYGLDSLDRGLYYIAHSGDSGATWSDPLVVSSDSTDFQLYDELIFFGDYYKTAYVDETAYVAWSDGRDTMGAKLYFAKIDPLNPSVRVIPVVPPDHDVWISDVYPSPANGEAFMKIRSERDHQSIISIYTIDGRPVYQEKFQIASGEQRYRLPHTLAPGIYVLECVVNGKKYPARFIMK